MSAAGDLRRLGWLLRHYLAPYWPAVLVLVGTSLVATALAGLLPVLMAPILDLALGSAPGPVSGVAIGEPLSLKNLGSWVFRSTGVHAGEDRFRAVVYLCLACVAVGLLKALADFGAYLLALWIRVRAAAAMQVDLFRHLLGLSMNFFTRQRTGELVSRLSSDTHAASSGLEIIAGTALTAPILIVFYGVLMVRTSPKMVGAALAAVAGHWLLTRVVSRHIRRLATDQFSLLARVSTHFQEAILSVRVVKSFGAEAFELAQLGRTLRETVRVNVRFGFSKHVEEPARAAAARSSHPVRQPARRPRRPPAPSRSGLRHPGRRSASRRGAGALAGGTQRRLSALVRGVRATGGAGDPAGPAPRAPTRAPLGT